MSDANSDYQSLSDYLFKNDKDKQSVFDAYIFRTGRYSYAIKY